MTNQQVMDCMAMLDYYLVENIRSARRYLSSLQVRSVQDVRFEKLDKHSSPRELPALLAPVLQGTSVGVLSEAGCPAIADPGNMVVMWAHQNDIQVVPLVGPSSILLALMGSGLNGQAFEFHGYLPIDKPALVNKIRGLEKGSRLDGKTQIFMETPYRNRSLLSAVLQTCGEKTQLCIACNLTGKDQLIKTASISSWKKAVPDLHKKPTIFLLQAFSA